ncbi:Uncharacterised protein [Legionella feeleii]|uniref:Uncharacterized protein n=1 Tax=Legionella feeleii TaxID=453 RepID=A0A2X1RVZ3_9GAMM|nr:Uncharacterised protein [Legionella feeleii]STX38121.1 Uncharacterised protein [Legionella feeleii]
MGIIFKNPTSLAYDNDGVIKDDESWMDEAGAQAWLH